MMIEALREAREALRQLVSDVESLVNESGGVYGLHLNGDEAPWGELDSGGRFEDWIGVPLTKARAALDKIDAALSAPQGKLPQGERERFEAWAESMGFRFHELDRGDSGRYCYGSTETAWQAWQARAAPQEQAQPVAWRYRYHDAGKWHLADEPALDVSASAPAFRQEPLYAAPPTEQAQTVALSLTDEQCDNAIRKVGLWQLACALPSNLALLRALARAGFETAPPTEQAQPKAWRYEYHDAKVTQEQAQPVAQHWAIFFNGKPASEVYENEGDARKEFERRQRQYPQDAHLRTLEPLYASPPTEQAQDT